MRLLTKVFNSVKGTIEYAAEKGKKTVKGAITLNETINSLTEKVARILANLSVERIQDNLIFIRHSWEKQSLNRLLNGEFALPEEVINYYLARAFSKETELKGGKISFYENNNLEIQFNSSRWGIIIVKGIIEKLNHNEEESCLSIRIREKRLIEKPFLSWLMFLSLDKLFFKFFGSVEMGDKIRIQLNQNLLILNFREALYEQIGEVVVCGQPLLDIVQIKGAFTEDGLLRIRTKFQPIDKIGEELELVA